MTNSSDLTLWYGPLLVGHISNTDFCTGTWTGGFVSAIDEDRSVLARRIRDFIQFCKRWQEQYDHGAQHPPDAAEFDQFPDMVIAGEWTVGTDIGTRRKITEAPFFSEEAFVSWRED